MAEIPVFNADPRLERGIEVPEGAAARAQAAARVAGSLGREAANQVESGIKSMGQALVQTGEHLKQQETYQELTAGATSYGDMMVKQKQALNDGINALQATPEKIPGFIAQWHQDSGNALSAWQSQFRTDRGKEWAAEHGATFTEHMFNEGYVANGQAAGLSARNLYNKALGSINSIVEMHPDALGYDQAMHQLDMTHQAATAIPGLSAEGRKAVEEQNQKMRGEVAYAIGAAAIVANPDHGLTLLPKIASELHDPKEIASLQELARNQRDRTGSEQLRQIEIQDRLKNDTWQQNMDQIQSTATLGPDAKWHYPAGTDKKLQDMEIRGQIGGAAAQAIRRGLSEDAFGLKTQANQALYDDVAALATKQPGDPDRLTLDRLNDLTGGSRGLKPEQNREIRALLDSDPTELAALATERNSVQKILAPLAGDPVTAAQAGNAMRDLNLAASRAKQQGSLREILDPKSPSYWARADPTLQNYKQPPPSLGTLGVPVSSNEAAHLAVARAQAITDRLRDTGSPEAVAKLASENGVPLTAEDIRSGRWCAILVNGVLKSVGLATTGSNLAESFGQSKNMVPISSINMQEGDVFLGSGAAGTTGHAGLVMGPPEIRGGQMQVRVVDTGNGGSTAGIHWKPVANLLFFRPRPTVADAVAQPSQSWGAWVGQKFSRGPSNLPPAAEEQ